MNQERGHRIEEKWIGLDYLEIDPGVGTGAEELGGPGNLVPGADVILHGRIPGGWEVARRRKGREGRATGKDERLQGFRGTTGWVWERFVCAVGSKKFGRAGKKKLYMQLERMIKIG